MAFMSSLFRVIKNHQPLYLRTEKNGPASCSYAVHDLLVRPSSQGLSSGTEWPGSCRRVWCKQFWKGSKITISANIKHG